MKSFFLSLQPIMFPTKPFSDEFIFFTTKLPLLLLIIQFILDVRVYLSVLCGRTSRGSHRRKATQDFVYLPFTVLALIFIASRIQPSLSLPPVLSTCPLHTNSGCGKERRVLIGPWWSAKAAPVRNYLEVYWPCAGGLSAVNAIGTQLRDPINSGLARSRMAV